MTLQRKVEGGTPAAMRSNAEWLAALRAGGRVQEQAFAELRLLMLRAIKAFLARKPAAAYADDVLPQIAEDCAQESVLIVQAKLDDFRGDSQFTTWAYIIAIRVVLGELRRRRWRATALDEAVLGQALPSWPIDDPGPERGLAQRQAWALLGGLIETEITPLQRKALIAHAFQDMPLDLVAEWLGTNRNSLYKLIHDARKRLKAALLSRGVSHRDLISIFEAPPRERSHFDESKSRRPHDVS
jgi:RNA polymerase sigma-70 factor, ECF subfamily